MAPELKELLHSSAAQPAEPFDMADVQRRGRRVRRARYGRAVVGAAAVLALVVFAAGTTMNALDRPSVEFADRPPNGDGDPYSGAPPPMWEEMPVAPITPRAEPVAVWTGSEMLVWGGQDPANDFRGLSDGAAYNPETKQWRMLPSPPLVAQGTTAGVWTGREMLVWNAFQQAGAGGAAYDPATDSWRLLPAAPIESYAQASAIWTGREMIVWGGHSQEGEAIALGAAFNPETNEWRRITDTPPPIAGRFNHGAVWTGTEMVVWGGTAGDGAETEYFADGAAYNPERGSWRLLADSPLSPREPGAMFWTGDRLIVAGGNPGGAEFATDLASYDPQRDRWRKLLDTHIPERVAYAWVGDHIITWGSPRGVVAVDASSSGTAALGATPVRLGFGGAAVRAEKQFIFWGGLARDSSPIDDGAVLNTNAYPSIGELPIGMPPEPSASDLQPAPPPDGGGEGGADEVGAVWPTAGIDGPWRKNPTTLAEEFGVQVLGWSDARVTDGEPSEDGHAGERLTLSSRKADSSVVVTIHPDEPVRGAVREYDGPYSIAGVGGASASKRESLHVAISGDEARVGFSPVKSKLPGAAKATLRLQYGARFGATHDVATPPPWEFIVPVSFPRNEPGSLLILIEDANGTVIGAQGTGLPPGDFAAG